MKKRGLKEMIAAAALCVAGIALFQIIGPILLSIALSAVSVALPVLLVYVFFVRRTPGGLGRRTETMDTERHEPECEDTQEPEAVQPKEEPAYSWYKKQGWEEIDRLMADLYASGIYECWVRRDGVCNKRNRKGYGKIGMLKDYPGEQAEQVARFLRQDGISAFVEGRYLHLRWAEE